MSGTDTKKRRKKPKNKYEKSLTGVMGRLGAHDSQINYLQTNISVSNMSILGLVSEIPGSERWPVRQLFQRDIDTTRVKREIIPYFLESSMAKFFNPLTIAVLPIDLKGTFESKLEESACKPSEDFAAAFALEDCYRLSYDPGDQPEGILEWNPEKARLIAIDGQHRLSALKRIYAMYQHDPTEERMVAVDFNNWIVPIVLVTAGHVENDVSADAILEKTRNIFVTINKQAKAPTRSRTILLNDYSVLAIACQEILDNCVGNGISLGVFNWREYKDEDRPNLSTYLMGVDDLEDLHKIYLIGDDESAPGDLALTDIQKGALYWSDMNPPAKPKMSNSELRLVLKNRYRETIMPAFFKLIKGCKPYSTYISFLNKLSASLKEDAQKHALSRLVYGSDYAPGMIESEVINEKIKILEACEKEKKKLGWLFEKAVGFRGLVSGFRIFADYYCESIKIDSWEKVSDEFIKDFNRLVVKKIYDGEKDLRHIVIDHTLSVVNYKVEQVEKGLGSFVAYTLITTCKERANYEVAPLRDTLFRTLLSGYKREHRPDVREQMTGKSNDEINIEIAKRAKVSANKQLTALDRKLTKLAQ